MSPFFLRHLFVGREPTPTRFRWWFRTGHGVHAAFVLRRRCRDSHLQRGGPLPRSGAPAGPGGRVAGSKRWGFSGEKMWKTREMDGIWMTESVWYSLMDDSVTVWPFWLCCVLLSLFVDCEPALPILFGAWTAHLLTPIRNMTQPIYLPWWFNKTIENHNFHGSADHLKMTIFRGSRDWKQDDYSVSIETLKNSCVIRAWLLGDGMWWKVAEDRKHLPSATRNSHLDWLKRSQESVFLCTVFIFVVSLSL